ncbi:MAG: hypothetical protein IPP40_01165 [bacterium]|nr:hypothetical protein [bacterium]
MIWLSLVFLTVSIAAAQTGISVDALIDGIDSPLRRPAAFAIGVGGLIYIADTGNNRLVAIDSTGKTIFESSKGGSDSELRWPIDVAIGSNGRVYVADSGKRRIVEYSRLLEWKGEMTVEDGEKNALEPRLIAGNPAGDLFVYESDNGQLLRYDNFFAVVARLGGQSGKQIGTLTGLSFSPTYGVLWINREDRMLYRCDAFLSEPHRLDALGPSMEVDQICAIDSTLFGLSSSMLYRREGSKIDSLPLGEMWGTTISPPDLRIEASSRNDLYLLEVSDGTLHRVYWP